MRNIGVLLQQTFRTVLAKQYQVIAGGKANHFAELRCGKAVRSLAADVSHRKKRRKQHACAEHNKQSPRNRVALPPARPFFLRFVIVQILRKVIIRNLLLPFSPNILFSHINPLSFRQPYIAAQRGKRLFNLLIAALYKLAAMHDALPLRRKRGCQQSRPAP